MIKKIIALMLILPALMFCKKNGGNENKPADPDDGTEASLVLTSDRKVSVNYEGGTGTITFTSNKNWSVSAESSWVTLNPESGSASTNPQSITYTVSENPKKTKRSSDVVVSVHGANISITISQLGNPNVGAAPELKSGDVVNATNNLVEKFLTEVTYADRTCKEYTKIFDYYGGFGSTVGEPLTWDNWEQDWPDGDIPPQYSIRWNIADNEDGVITLHMEDALGWSGNMEIAAGSAYVNITNLVPNDSYSYKVTAASGKILAQGTFQTVGTLHQVYFHGDPSKPNVKGGGGRNARDFGGWKTLDGKTIKYRKVYRGGRLNEKWTPYPLNAEGEKEVLFEGLGAELELRGSDDYMTVPAVTGLDHCHPCIEEGGKVMLGVTKPSAKNCAKWLVLDAASPWSAEKKAPYLTDGEINKDKIGEITPTAAEYDAFQAAYKAKTKECFEFVVNSVKAGKGVYFHCSLGRDRTGTLGILLLGILGVREGDIAKEYELTYFAPVGYSVSISDQKSNPTPTFKNTRMSWVYSDVVPYFWELAGDGTFAQGVEKYLLEVAGVPQEDIDEFRSLMLE